MPKDKAKAAAAAAVAAVQKDGFLDSRKGPTPGLVPNKIRRRELYAQQKKAKKADRRVRREAHKRDASSTAGDASAAAQDGQPPAKRVPKTLDNMREKDDTIVDPEDDEVMQDQATDELASYFDGKEPKVLITTSNKACGDAYQFGEILANMIPSAQFFKRKGFELKTIIKQAIAKGFTDVMVINEDKKKVNGLVVSHLPDGPTAHFKVTNIKYAKEIHNHGASTMHYPEVIINNFHTRLGHQVGRQLTALFPQVPEFEGRAVVTFHNQRDFIFVRRHRYIFRNKERVGLQELGPRFTLKLRSLQKGTFDTKFGEYEFVYRSELGTGRRKFFL